MCQAALWYCSAFQSSMCWLSRSVHRKRLTQSITPMMSWLNTVLAGLYKGHNVCWTSSHFQDLWQRITCNRNTCTTDWGVDWAQISSWCRIWGVVVLKTTIFWDITPCSPLRINRHFGRTYCLHLLASCSHAGPCSAYFLTLKMEAICSSERSVDSRRTTWHYIPEDGTLSSWWLQDVNGAHTELYWFITILPMWYAAILSSFYSY
jgi:hypothetical protein